MSDTYAGLLETLLSRARIARIALQCFMVAAFAAALATLGEIVGIVDLEFGLDELSLAASLVHLAYFVVLIACAVAVGMWIHAAHTNAQAHATSKPDITPGWAVGWFFVPIANLFKPYDAMRQLWTASTGESTPAVPALLPRWWGCWIVGNILSKVSGRILRDVPEVGQFGDLLSSFILMAAAKFLIDIVGEITASQRSGTMAASVFA